MSTRTLRRPSGRPSGRPSTGQLVRWAILLVAAVYFVGPLVAAFSFTIEKTGGGISFSPYGQIFSTHAQGQISFTGSLTYSLLLSAATIIVTLLLMVPTQIVLRLYAPRLQPVVETICLLPLVFPPVVLVVGVSSIYRVAGQSGPLSSLLVWIREQQHPLLLVLLYSVMSLPFVYRAIRAGIEAVPLVTLVEAARNLGASWPRTIVSVVLPTMRTALINAGFLCFALAMGEYTIAGILLYTKPFPVWLSQLPATSGQEQAAISVLSLLLVELALLLVSGLGITSKKGQS